MLHSEGMRRRERERERERDGCSVESSSDWNTSRERTVTIFTSWLFNADHSWNIASEWGRKSQEEKNNLINIRQKKDDFMDYCSQNPDVTPSSWLGSKHQPTNELAARKTTRKIVLGLALDLIRVLQKWRGEKKPYDKFVKTYLVTRTIYQHQWGLNCQVHSLDWVGRFRLRSKTHTKTMPKLI